MLFRSGSDSSGAGGIQADIKTVTALGGYAASAVTAVAVRSTRKLNGMVGMASDFVRLQMQVVFDDVGADAVKTGNLYNAETINAVAAEVEARGDLILVVDPLVATREGVRLLDVEAIAALKRRLICHADLITPNRAEAEALSGMSIGDTDAMKHAAETLLTLGCGAVLVTGGDMPGDELCDVLATEDGVQMFHSRRIATKATAGTGPTIASAVATGLAQRVEIGRAHV